jgi:hypothetical protein
VLFVAGKTWAQGWAVIVAATFNVALNLVLVPLWGIAGSAWATLVSYGLLAVWMRRAANAEMRLRRPSTSIYLQMAVTVVALVAFVYVPTSPGYLLGRGVVGVGCLVWLARVAKAIRSGEADGSDGRPQPEPQSQHGPSANGSATVQPRVLAGGLRVPPGCLTITPGRRRVAAAHLGETSSHRAPAGQLTVRLISAPRPAPAQADREPAVLGDRDR